MLSKKVIGVMSGTSLDGLDIALCHFQYGLDWEYKIIQATTIPYPEYWIKKLRTAQSLSTSTLKELDKEYGEFIGNTVLEFIQSNNHTVDLIASHGHTIFHQPEKQYTLQIGNGSTISSITKTTTVSDFRSLDVTLGGQGAPLVPIGDKLLFGNYNYYLGGFSNISFEKNNQRIAFDICPVNIILNQLSQEEGFPFDKNGVLGKQGNINTKLLSELNDLDFYKKPYPKSLGKEWLDKNFVPILDKYTMSVKDKLRTTYEHIAHQISKVLKQKNAGILISGGGALNTFLIDLIKEKADAEILIPSKEIIEYKEALIFALLGLLRFENKINCLCSVTGAKRDSSGGTIHRV